MVQPVLVRGLFGMVLMVGCSWCLAVGGAAGNRPATLAEKLETPITFPGFEPNTPLKEALEFLSDKHELSILIDFEAFKAEGIQLVEEQPVRLPKLRNVRLKTALRMLLSQVQGAILIRPEFIEITTPRRMAAEVWGNVLPAQLDDASTGRQRPMMQLVHVEFSRRPLEEALHELSDSTGISIVLDARRAGDKAKAVVTARLANTPLDTAVRLLANQAELASVLIDNVLVVTTPENSKSLREEQDSLNKKGLEPVPPAASPPAAKLSLPFRAVASHDR